MTYLEKTLDMPIPDGAWGYKFVLQDPRGINTFVVDDGYTGPVGTIFRRSGGGSTIEEEITFDVTKHVPHDELERQRLSKTEWADIEHMKVDIVRTPYVKDGEPVPNRVTTRSYTFLEGSHLQITGTTQNNGWVARHDNGQWENGKRAF